MLAQRLCALFLRAPLRHPDAAGAAGAAVRRALSTSGPPPATVPMRDFDVSPLHVAGVRGAKTVVEEYDPSGFTINNVKLRGSVMVFPYHTLMFRHNDMADLSVGALAAISLVEPSVELLVVGCGDNIAQRLDPAIEAHFRKQGTVIELMNTVNACATFNILNSEDRSVSAVLLCPPVDPEDEEDDVDSTIRNIISKNAGSTPY